MIDGGLMFADDNYDIRRSKNHLDNVVRYLF